VYYTTRFDVFIDPAVSVANIGDVGLLRLGAMTRSFDQDVRIVDLDFVPKPTPNKLRVSAPSDGNLAPPGYYVLFVVTDTDLPCEHRCRVNIRRRIKGGAPRG